MQMPPINLPNWIAWHSDNRYLDDAMPKPHARTKPTAKDSSSSTANLHTAIINRLIKR